MLKVGDFLYVTGSQLAMYGIPGVRYNKEINSRYSPPQANILPLFQTHTVIYCQ